MENLSGKVRKRSEHEAADSVDNIEELLEKLQLVQALEGEESELLAEVYTLENGIPLFDLDRALTNSSSNLSSVKKEVGATMRAALALKKEIDDMPAQPELIQYERRFAELYSQIQEKHRQTRKQYATYNALTDMKELLQKELSLLNSIDSQFQDAMSSTTGRSKLVDSMDIIVRGAQQKLEKVQVNFYSAQRACDYTKEEHAKLAEVQRKVSSILKAFQEECARNERLRELSGSSTSGPPVQ